MNNITFGDETLGYYETVAGGAGAGPTWHGRSGVHTHMTNTRITDPEVLLMGGGLVNKLALMIADRFWSDVILLFLKSFISVITLVGPAGTFGVAYFAVEHFTTESIHLDGCGVCPQISWR